jgi:hypothetical protein
MAGVRVRIEDFEDGVYPDVCASSGVEGGTRLYRADISSQSRWVWLLVFAGPMGILAALALSGLLRKTASGYVPYTPAVQERLRQRARTFAWVVVGSIGLLLGSGLLAAQGPSAYQGLGALGFIAGTIGVLVFTFLWSHVPGSVGGHLDSTGRWIELEPVSAAFAFAYEQQEARRRAARRAATYEPDDVWGR